MLLIWPKWLVEREVYYSIQCVCVCLCWTGAVQNSSVRQNIFNETNTCNNYQNHVRICASEWEIFKYVVTIVSARSFGTILQWNVVRLIKVSVCVCVSCEITIEYDILHLMPTTINNQFTTRSSPYYKRMQNTISTQYYYSPSIDSLIA